MNHPMLIAALATDGRRQCICGAVTQSPGHLCRRCRADTTWRRESARMSCRRDQGWARGRTARDRILTWMASLLQCISKGAES